MTKVIAAFLIVVVVYGGWELFLSWDKVKNEEETKQKQDAAAMVVGDQLPGLPYKLEASLQAARKQGRGRLEELAQDLRPERGGPAQGLDRAGLLRRRRPARTRRKPNASSPRSRSASSPASPSGRG